MRVKDPAKTALIHNAALRLTLLHGIDGLKMADIAKEAGIATGTLYVYFEDKEALLGSLYAAVQATCRQHLPKAERKEEPFRVLFKNAFITAQQYWVIHFAEAIFMDQFYHSSYISAAMKKEPMPLEDYFSLLLAGAKRQLLVKDMDTDLLLCAITGLLRQAEMLCVRAEKKLNKPLLEKLFTLCWDGIKA